MGGEVAFAIKRNGRVSVRELSKYAACQVTRGDFFEERGELWSEWKRTRAQPFAPIHYGLVVVDFDAKWVGGIQSYTSFDKRYVYVSEKGDIADLETVWNQGRIKSGQSDQEAPSIPSQETSFHEWLDPLLLKKGRAGGFHSITVAVAPPKGWEIESFSKNEAGWRSFIDALLQRDFKITAREIPVWEEFFKYEEIPVETAGRTVADHVARKLEANTKRPTTMRPRHRI
jgi:hypothetical protein